MSKEYDNTNSGVLYVNKKKTKDTQPKFTGSINVDGTDYWLSAWPKKAKNGDTFLSLAVNLKDNPAEKPDNTFLDNEGDTPF